MPRVTGVDAARWARGFDEVLERIGGRFGRAEPRRRVEAYLRGLLAPVERKNGWQLAQAAGDATPAGVQEFLSRVRWDADAVRDDLQAYVAEHLGDPNAVLVLDETCQRAPKCPQLWAFKIPWPAGSVRIGDQPAV